MRLCVYIPPLWSNARYLDQRAWALRGEGNLRTPPTIGMPLSRRALFLSTQTPTGQHSVGTTPYRQEPARTSPSGRAERLKAKRLAGRTGRRHHVNTAPRVGLMTAPGLAMQRAPFRNALLFFFFVPTARANAPTSVLKETNDEGAT